MKSVKSIKCIISLLMVLMFSFNFTITSFAHESDIKFSDKKSMIIPINNYTDLCLSINVAESQKGKFVYANAHGEFHYSGKTKSISQYGMDVTFKVAGNTSNISYGGSIHSYHNSSVSEYTALKETRMSDEETENCAVTGVFTIVSSDGKKNTANITLKLSIDSNGKKTMQINGNYKKWNVIWG